MDEAQPRAPEVVIRHGGEGRRLVFFGGQQEIAVKLTGADSLGRLGVYEVTMQPRTMGASPHFHRELVEAFYCLEGELLLYAKDRKVLATAGSFVSIPPRTIHAFANPADGPNRFLLLFTNDTNRVEYFEQSIVYAEAGTRPDPVAKVESEIAFDLYRVQGVDFTLDRP